MKCPCATCGMPVLPAYGYCLICDTQITVAFIGRHSPTAEQEALFSQQNRQLEPVGDVDGFDFQAVKALILPLARKGYTEFATANVAIALNIARLAPMEGWRIWAVENGARPTEDGKPSFYAKAIHAWIAADDEGVSGEEIK